MDVIMHDFKVGDKFQVKEAWLDMTINKDYEVLKVEDGHVTCINDFNEMNDLRIGDVVPSFYKENKVKNPNVKHYELWNDFEVSLYPIVNNITKMLIEKNRKYGNSALKPQRIFSKASAVEQIKVRIDDKLSRMKNQQNDEDEDVISDLIGYLILLKIAKEGN